MIVCPKCKEEIFFNMGDRPKGPKPEPTPLPPLRRLQGVDEVARPLPKPLPTPKRLQEVYKRLAPRGWVRPLEPDEELLIRIFPSASRDEKVLFTCLCIALVIIMLLRLGVFSV